MEIKIEITPADLAEMGVPEELLSQGIARHLERGIELNDGSTLYLNDVRVDVRLGAE